MSSVGFFFCDFIKKDVNVIAFKGHTKHDEKASEPFCFITFDSCSGNCIFCPVKMARKKLSEFDLNGRQKAGCEINHAKYEAQRQEIIKEITEAETSTLRTDKNIKKIY